MLARKRRKKSRVLKNNTYNQDIKRTQTITRATEEPEGAQKRKGENTITRSRDEEPLGREQRLTGERRLRMKIIIRHVINWIQTGYRGVGMSNITTKTGRREDRRGEENMQERDGVVHSQGTERGRQKRQRETERRD